MMKALLYLCWTPGAHVEVLTDVLCGALGVGLVLVGEGEDAGLTLVGPVPHHAGVIYAPLASQLGSKY
jgi:hypothetical protein